MSALKQDCTLQSRNCFTLCFLVFFTTVCGKPQHMANHPDCVASDIKASSPAKPTAPQHSEGWPEWSRELRLVEVYLRKKDHLRAGTAARLGSGSANLSCSSFESTFLNVLPWGQRNSQNMNEFFRRMECVYCCSPRHKRDRKGLFSDFKEDILSINFQKHIQTKTHKNTTYMNMNMWLPLPPFLQKPILVNHLHVPLL